MKVVINKCYGGFGLSLEAIKQIATWQGRECYFFTQDTSGGVLGKYIPCEQDDTSLLLFAFDIPNPNEALAYPRPWGEMSREERDAHNKLYEQHELDRDRNDRADPLLIRAVEELGEKASGRFAKLEVVEIPDGIDYEISDYDGIESIHEVHRSWS